MTKTSWYADGTGLVKSMTEARHIKYGWELADYNFKNKDRNKERGSLFFALEHPARC